MRDDVSPHLPLSYAFVAHLAVAAGGIIQSKYLSI